MSAARARSGDRGPRARKPAGHRAHAQKAGSRARGPRPREATPRPRSSARVVPPSLWPGSPPRRPCPPRLPQRVRPCASVVPVGTWGRERKGLDTAVAPGAADLDTHFGLLYCLVHRRKTRHIAKGLLLHVTPLPFPNPGPQGKRETSQAFRARFFWKKEERAPRGRGCQAGLAVQRRRRGRERPGARVPEACPGGGPTRLAEPGTNQRSRPGTGGREGGRGEGGDPPGRRGSHSLLPETPPHSDAHPPSRGALRRGCSSPAGRRAAVSPRRASVAQLPSAPAARQPRAAPESAVAAAGKGCGPASAALRTRRRGPGFDALRGLQEQVTWRVGGGAAGPRRGSRRERRPRAPSRSGGPAGRGVRRCDRNPRVPNAGVRCRPPPARPAGPGGRPDGREVRRRREAGPGAPPEAGRGRGPRCVPGLRVPGGPPGPSAALPPPGLSGFPPGLDLARLPGCLRRSRQSLLGTWGPPEYVVVSKAVDGLTSSHVLILNTAGGDLPLPGPHSPPQASSSPGPCLNPLLSSGPSLRGVRLQIGFP